MTMSEHMALLPAGTGAQLDDELLDSFDRATVGCRLDLLTSCYGARSADVSARIYTLAGMTHVSATLKAC